MSDISKDFAMRKYKNVLAKIFLGGTEVHEVIGFKIDNVNGFKKALDMVNPSVALWQHTDKYHVAGIYVPKGTGYMYNRSILDLISSGVDTPEKFSRAWNKHNHKRTIGTIPKVRSSASSGVRKQQASYILANLSQKPNPNSRIKGHLKPDIPHRTHLISEQITGIESDKGLLIDFDGWLNTKPMNDFEASVLKLSNHQDIIWYTYIYRQLDGLHWIYNIYDNNWNIIDHAEWVDDRWNYIWRYDEGQDKIE